MEHSPKKIKLYSWKDVQVEFSDPVMQTTTAADANQNPRRGVYVSTYSYWLRPTSTQSLS